MTRLTAFTTPIVALALCSLLWLSSLAPALAATVTDTFQLKLTGTERCRNNPNFVEPFKVKFTEGATLALTRDDIGVLTDVQATLDNTGNATIDAIALTGRAFPKNAAGLKAELVLSGRDPGNPDRFLTLRGTATFNTAGKLTNMTGTFIFHILDDLNGAPNIDCFGSGTFVAKKPPSSGGGGGTLTVANAPASVKGTFVAYPKATAVNVNGTFAAVAWAELPPAGNPGHAEVISVGFDATTGQVLNVSFTMADGSVGTGWGCSVSLLSACAGASVNRTTGTFTVLNTVLDITAASGSPITLNGTLNFPPF